jgi:hypothetical protein
MGFYGNISNTSKASFQFDRIYANKHDMDIGAQLGDGIYPGRFVLIDYSQQTNDQFYDIGNNTDPNNTYWFYNGQLYSGSPNRTDIGGKLFYNYPNDQAALLTSLDGFNVGDIVLIREGKRVGNLNQYSKYVKVKSIKSDGTCELEPNHNSYEYMEWMDNYIAEKIEKAMLGRPQSEIKTAIKAERDKTFVPIVLNEITYEAGTFFVKNDENEYTYDLAGKFVTGTEYFERVLDSTLEKPLQIYYTSYTRNEDNASIGVDVLTANKQLFEGRMYRVPKWHSYTLNNKSEYWQVAQIKADGTLVWRAIVDDKTSADPYIRNMSIDRADISLYGSSDNIGASRGYDATVWQKTVVMGQDKYVMVAELNSVVPTFDIAYDAPTGIPVVPHFDKDSTNVYYKLHTQPQWGFRPKAANLIELPSLDASGAEGAGVPSRSDITVYPSDQSVHWKNDFYNTFTGQSTTKYFDVKSSTWLARTSEEGITPTPAAIYYNKKGFNPEKVSYSKDLLDEGLVNGYNRTIALSGWTNEDNISIAPTGFSGQRYNAHDKGDSAVQVDTQELSIMLPSLGDTVAQIWDMVFGGRDTNDVIRTTGARNTDYQWEDAKGILDRNGLRLVQYRNDKQYNTAEVNTLAGCINSAHDIMGMIIMSDTPEHLTANLDHLDEERIYYIAPGTGGDEAIRKLEGQYAMKYKTYKYTPVQLVQGYAPLEEEETSSSFNKTDYWVKDENGEYRKATSADEGPFYKLVENMINNDDVYDEVKDLAIWPPAGKKYHYLDINSSPYNQSYNEDGSLNLTMQDYVFDTKYQKGHQYYTVTPGATLELSGAYESGKYFYKGETEYGEGYWLDFAETSTLDRQYYVINEDLVEPVKSGDCDGIYVPGLYYYYDGTKYIKDTSLNGTYVDASGKTKSRVHYSIKTIKKDDDNDKTDYIEQVTYSAITNKSEIELMLLNAPGLVYRKEYTSSGSLQDANGKYNYVEVKSGDVINTDTTKYFLKELTYVPSQEIYEIDDTPLTLVPFKENTFFFKKFDSQKKFLGYYPVKRTDIKANDASQQYYAFGKRYNAPDDPTDNSYEFVAVGDSGNNKFNFALTLQSAFYTPHVYHYITDNGSYILDNFAVKTHDSYCNIVKATPVDFGDTVFYEPDEFYTYNELTGDYELVKDLEKPSVVDKFYTADKYYIYEDTAGIYEKGAEWDVSILEVPPTVTLAKREVAWELKPLEGFARQLNTMHGLILKINNMLLAGDKLTRDQSTVQGTINKMNDLIARFHDLAPKKILAVDNYGRVRGMDWTTDQKDSATKAKTLDSDRKGVTADTFAKEAATVDEMYKQWITVNVDGSYEKDKQPTITVHHNFQKVTDSLNNGKNMNVAEENIATDDANKITLQTPFVDAMGHVVGRKEVTYTLPFGFKSIHTNGRSTVETENASSNPTKTPVAADCTQDILNINSGNKWIRIDTDGINDSLTISHDVHNFATDGKATASLSSETSKAVTFDTVTYDFDKAGHFTGKTIKTITMPYGYGKIVGDSGTTSASATFDTLTLATDNWLTATVTADKVTFSHDYPDKQDDTTSTSNVNGNGDTIVLETIARDTKGHVTKVNQNTVTLPFGYKVFTDSNATVGKSTAANTQDTFAFKGDSWLKPTVTQGKVVFEHTGPVSSTYTAKQNVSPKFGETFTIEDWFFDNKGHKFQGTTHTVQIPSLSLTNSDAGNVVTGVALTPETGAFVETKENLSSLLLTGYEAGEDNSNIVAEDTLGQALSKLQVQITDEVENREEAVTGIFTTVSEDVVYEVPDETELEGFDDKDKTIAWLFKKVAQLETLIKDLGIAESETV